MLTLSRPRPQQNPLRTSETAMSAAELQIIITPGSEGLTVTLAGEANFGFDKSEEHIRSILRHNAPRVVIDAAKLTFISSIGMCFLINLRKAVKDAGGQLKVARLQPMVRKAMEHAHVIHLFEVTD
jgi:anti-anti-sigma factor